MRVAGRLCGASSRISRDDLFARGVALVADGAPAGLDESAAARVLAARASLRTWLTFRASAAICLRGDRPRAGPRPQASRCGQQLDRPGLELGLQSWVMREHDLGDRGSSSRPSAARTLAAEVGGWTFGRSERPAPRRAPRRRSAAIRASRARSRAASGCSAEAKPSRDGRERLPGPSTRRPGARRRRYERRCGGSRRGSGSRAARSRSRKRVELRSGDLARSGSRRPASIARHCRPTVAIRIVPSVKQPRPDRPRVVGSASARPGCARRRAAGSPTMPATASSRRPTASRTNESSLALPAADAGSARRCAGSACRRRGAPARRAARAAGRRPSILRAAMATCSCTSGDGSPASDDDLLARPLASTCRMLPAARTPQARRPGSSWASSVAWNSAPSVPLPTSAHRACIRALRGGRVVERPAARSLRRGSPASFRSASSRWAMSRKKTFGLSSRSISWSSRLLRQVEAGARGVSL